MRDGDPFFVLALLGAHPDMDHTVPFANFDPGANCQPRQSLELQSQTGANCGQQSRCQNPDNGTDPKTHCRTAKIWRRPAQARADDRIKCQYKRIHRPVISHEIQHKKPHQLHVTAIWAAHGPALFTFNPV